MTDRQLVLLGEESRPGLSPIRTDKDLSLSSYICDIAAFESNKIFLTLLTLLSLSPITHGRIRLASVEHRPPVNPCAKPFPFSHKSHEVTSKVEKLLETHFTDEEAKTLTGQVTAGGNRAPRS